MVFRHLSTGALESLKLEAGAFWRGSGVTLALLACLACGSDADSAADVPSAVTGAPAVAAPAAPATNAGAPAAPVPTAPTPAVTPVSVNEGAPPVQAPPAAPEAEETGGAAEGETAAENTTPTDGEVPADTTVPPEPVATNPEPTQDFPVADGKPTVYLASDSTVQTYSAAQAPQQGWGQRIQEFFTTDVVIVNRAIGGRSSKSYIDEGRLDEIVADIKKGDYLFAQWGINDRYRSDPTRFTDPSTTFKQYLQQYIDAAHSKDAIPVLLTPTPRLDFTNGAFQNDFAEYCAAIKEVGAATNTVVIDLQTRGLAYYTSIGLAEVQDVISLDVLHFKTEGAFQMARLVSEGVKDSVLPIGQFVK